MYTLYGLSTDQGGQVRDARVYGGLPILLLLVVATGTSVVVSGFVVTGSSGTG